MLYVPLDAHIEEGVVGEAHGGSMRKGVPHVLLSLDFISQRRPGNEIIRSVF